MCALLFLSALALIVRSSGHWDIVSIRIWTGTKVDHFITLSSFEHVLEVNYRTMWEGEQLPMRPARWGFLTYTQPYTRDAWKNGVTDITANGTEHRITYRFLGFALGSFIQQIRVGDPDAMEWLVLRREHSLATPYWFILLMSPILFVLALRHATHARTLRERQLDAVCIHCGYDLRGNVSGRCPECGSSCRERDVSDAASRSRWTEGPPVGRARV